jgi:asparagine synthase (glutamine-hydrolysing)
MGGLAAILHRDGRPLEPSDLSRVAARSSYRAPDGLRASTHGAAGLASLQFRTIPTADVAQPLFDPERQLFFVFDGRLDNRGELLAALGLDASSTDARIAMAAAGRWQEGTPARLLGDFAFVAWDASRRRLLCARDHMGARPLHYFVSPRLLVCASDLAQVLAHPDVPCSPNPLVAADYLALDVANGPATLYRDVQRVPPGHALVVTDDAVRLVRYWTPEPGTPIRYRGDEPYVEHCRDLLVRSVEGRMRSDRPVAAFLSGGVDSSSVVTVAHRMVRGPAPPPRPFSLVFPAHPESDEQPFIAAVEEACGTSAVRTPPATISGEALARRAALWAAPPGMAADEMSRTAFAAITAEGHRVVLTGAGGDFLFSGSVFQYADLLRAARPVAALRRMIDDWRADDTGRTPLGFLQAGLWPLLPPRARSVLRPLARRLYGITDQPSWLRIRRHVDPYPAMPRGGSFATEEVTRALGSGLHAYFLESAEHTAAEHAVEVRNPLLDKRLIDFALNIPDDQRRRGVLTKFVLRAAVAPHLAPAVARRRTKADFSHAVVEAIEASGGERMFASLRLAEAGWVEPAPLRAMYERMRRAQRTGGAAGGADLPALWMVTALELWLRAFDAGTHPAHRVAAV